jgi:hypothetical protein
MSTRRGRKLKTVIVTAGLSAMRAGGGQDVPFPLPGRAENHHEYGAISSRGAGAPTN